MPLIWGATATGGRYAARMDMTNPAVAGFVGVVVGAVIAGLVNIGGELLRGWQSSKLDNQKRHDDRRIRLDEIQRTNLLDLQTALAGWLRAEGRLHGFDVMALRAGGTLTQVPQDVNQEHYDSGRRLALLTERVKDDTLRSMLLDLRGQGSSQDAMRAIRHREITEAELDADLNALMATARKADDRLGGVLRGYL